MNELMQKYEFLVDEENELLRRIRTCEICLLAIFEMIYKKANRCHVKMTEDILTGVHNVSIDLRTELVHIRLDKALVSYQINKNSSE